MKSEWFATTKVCVGTLVRKRHLPSNYARKSIMKNWVVLITFFLSTNDAHAICALMSGSTFDFRILMKRLLAHLYGYDRRCSCCCSLTWPSFSVTTFVALFQLSEREHRCRTEPESSWLRHKKVCLVLITNIWEPKTRTNLPHASRRNNFQFLTERHCVESRLETWDAQSLALKLTSYITKLMKRVTHSLLIVAGQTEILSLSFKISRLIHVCN